MAKKQKVRYIVTIRTNALDFGGGDVPAFLDMLRYDGAQVITWNQTTITRMGRAQAALQVTLEAERPSFDRWHSFGLYPTDERGGRLVGVKA